MRYSSHLVKYITDIADISFGELLAEKAAPLSVAC